MKTQTLTKLQKKQIIDELQRRRDAGEVCHQILLAQWAKNKFELERPPSQPTLSRILNRTSSDDVPHLFKRQKREVTGRNHPVETALYEWVVDRYRHGAKIHGELIRSQAVKLQQMSNDLLPESHRVHLKFSNGWLQNFQSRWRVKHSKPSSALDLQEHDSLEQYRSNLLPLLAGYSSKNIWNADECGLYWKLPPDTSISAIPSSKNAPYPNRFSCLFCCNADGSEKFNLSFVGSTDNPLIRSSTSTTLPFDYLHNKHGWMSSSLFVDWLYRFDSYIAQTDGRKVALLIDECSAHGTSATLPSFDHVTVIFISQFNANGIHPLHHGIIDSVKLQYRIRQLQYAQDLMEEVVADTYLVDICTAMHWLHNIWQKISPSVIVASWNLSGLVLSKIPPPSRSETDTPDRSELERMLHYLISVLVHPSHRMSISAFLNPFTEDAQCTQVVSDDTLVEQIVQSITLSNGQAGPTQPNSGRDIVPLPPISEQLRAVAVVKRMIGWNEHSTDNSVLKREIINLQKSLRSQQPKGVRHNTSRPIVVNWPNKA